MKIYFSIGGESKKKVEPYRHDFERFSSFIKNSAEGEILEGFESRNLRLRDLRGWYKEDVDERLVGYVGGENFGGLRNFITQPYGEEGVQDSEVRKEYLRNLRFDSDGLATIMYKDCSGWSLLNVAAAGHNPDMVDFLVDEVGMDINTVCHGVNPLFCCFVSMHDISGSGVDDRRLRVAERFISKGANVAMISDTSSKIMPINSAGLIFDERIRRKALDLLAKEMSLDDLNYAASKNSYGDDLSRYIAAKQKEVPSLSAENPSAKAAAEEEKKENYR